MFGEGGRGHFQFFRALIEHSCKRTPLLKLLDPPLVESEAFANGLLTEVTTERLTKGTFVRHTTIDKVLTFRIVQFVNGLRPSTGFA